MSTPIKFHMDEHVRLAVTRGLHHRGVDVVTAQEVELLAASDKTHLIFATAEGRAIFTQDADFLRLHAIGLPHSGIVYAPQHTPVGQLIRGLFLIHQVLNAEAMRDHVEFL